MSDDPKFARWSEPATKGDLIKALAYVRSVTVHLTSAVLSARNGTDAEFIQKMRDVFDEDDDLSKLLEDMGDGNP